MSVLPGPFGEATSRLERRFLTTAVVPTVVFLTSVSVVGLLAFNGTGKLVKYWHDMDVSEKFIAGLLAASAIWFVATMVSSNWRKIVRLYEGYPLAQFYRYLARKRDLDLWFLAQWIPGAAYHLKRQRSISLRSAYRLYPHSVYEAEVLPTTIGNILLSAERYGLQRYGLDVTLLWPRLYWYIPDEARKDLDAFKEEHQLPLALSFMAFCFCALSGALVLSASGSWYLFAVSTATGLGLALAAYLLALERAEEYGEQLKSAVDLHHSALRDVWSEPEADEKEFYARAEFFVLSGSYRDAFSVPDVETTNGADEIPVPRQMKRPPTGVRLILTHCRLLLLAALTGAILIAAGSVLLWTREVPVVVPEHDVAQFAWIGPTKVVRMPRSQLPTNILANPSAARSILALQPLKAGHPIPTDGTLPIESFPGAVTVRLSISRGRLPNGLIPGDHVSVTLSNCHLTLPTVLLLASDMSPESPTITALISASDSSKVSNCGSNSVAISR